MRIARVFPRRTSQTPRDELAFVGWPQLFSIDVDEVHVSVSFTWDKPLAEKLAEAWKRVAPVKLGGPAYGDRGGNFVPGRYLRPGNVITSRGCPNNCWFCTVPQREGRAIRELPIVDGWNVQDDNLLACSEDHIQAVFVMLSRQPQRAHFTGGLEAARLEDWHVALLRELRPKQLFFAYDTADDWEPLEDAGRRLLKAGYTRASHQLRCYVLIGGPQDTIDAAEHRLQQTMAVGFLPMAMLWRNHKGKVTAGWKAFQRSWARPAMLATRYRASAE